MNPSFPTTSTKFMKEWPRFSSWLMSRGSEIRVPSNSYELARFTTPQGVGLVHRNKLGNVTSWCGGAEEAWRAWKADAEWRVGSRTKRDKNSRKRQHRIATLTERDGGDCFFCGRPLGTDVTLEHLVPIAHGGPDHPSNLFLAHEDCNQTAGQLSAAEKVAMRDLLMPAGKKTTAQKATNLKHDPYAEFRNSAEKRGSFDNGPTRLLLPSTAFKKALMSAALDMPTGVAKTQIGRLTWVVGEKIDVFGIPKLSMEVVRSADMNRTPDVRTRAVCEEWACRVTFRFVEPNLSAQSVGTLFAAAGMLIGVGDKRQEKGAGNQGQFILVDENDPDFQRLLRTGGMAAQDAALEAAEPRDAQSEELLRWFDDELERRGKHTSTKQISA